MIKLLVVFSVVSLMVLGFSGCGGSTKSIIPSVKTTEQIKINSFSLSVKQLVTPEIAYHTEKEIRDLIEEKVISQLKEINLLTSDNRANSLDIRITYHRKFVGDATPFPSDSLAYPIVDFEIKLNDGEKVLKTISRKDLRVNGGFVMNLKVMGGTLREKSDEDYFIDVLSNTITEFIKQL